MCSTTTTTTANNDTVTGSINAAVHTSDVMF